MRFDQAESRRVALSSGLWIPRNERSPRIGKKNRENNGRNCMHWNVSLDALAESAILVHVLDHRLDNCIMYD